MSYIDWSQQELAIAAALSGDLNMQEAYRSGDFYLTFAKMAGYAPPHATRESHSTEREKFKVLALGVLYGLTGFGLARKLGMTTPYGEELLRIHKKTFRRFWTWSDGIETIARLKQQLKTVFGWQLSVRNDTKSNTIRNYPMQANGAEMMRVAAIMAMESNIRVCCPIHDAFLIESSVEDIESDTERMREIGV